MSIKTDWQDWHPALCCQRNDPSTSSSRMSRPCITIRPLWFIAGGAALLAAVACTAIPRDIKAPGARLIIRRQYGLFYLLQFLEGWRKQIFIAFASFMLVKQFNTPLATILLLFLAAQMLGWFAQPTVGRCIDRFGERPVLLFSGGKDSIVMLRLAEKAFWPAKLPFPVMHIDTGHNFDEVIAFRDARVAELGARLIVASVQESIDIARAEIHRLDSIVTQFLRAIRPSRPQLHPENVNELLQEAIRFFRPEIKDRDIVVKTELRSDLPLLELTDRKQRQLLSDLVDDLLLRTVVIVADRHRSPPDREPENSGPGRGCHTPGPPLDRGGSSIFRTRNRVFPSVRPMR